MNILHSYGILLRNLILFKRSFPKLMGTFGFVTFDLLVWGFVSLWFQDIATGPSIAAALLAALVLWDVFTRIQGSFSIAFLEDVWSRNIVNIFAAPITLRELVFGFILLSIVQGALILLYVSALAFLFFALNIWSLELALIPALLSLFIFGWAMGLVIMGVVLRFGPSAEILAFFLSFFILPFSAVFYPVSILPEFIQPLAYALPTSHVFEGIRAAISGTPLPLETGFLAVVLSAAYFALGLLFFALMFRAARAKGLIVRLLQS